MFTTLYERSIERLSLIVEGILGDGDMGKSANTRVEHFENSYNLITESIGNFIFGTGIGSFSIETMGIDGRGYPHNIILEVWTELGIIGVILLICFFASLFWRFSVERLYISGYVVLYFLLGYSKSSSLVDLRVGVTFCLLFICSVNMYIKNIVLMYDVLLYAKCMIYNVYLIVLLSLFSCASEIDKSDFSDRKIDEKYRFIYDAVKEGPEFEYFKYEVTDWRSIVSKHPFDTPKIPALGWKVMGPFISLYHAYRLTNDSYFSDLLGEMTEELVKSRDDIRSVVSWNGKIYPLWASGRRSHNAYFEIKDIYGKVCAIVDFHGSGFDDTYVSLKPHGEEFDFFN
ncbi:O-antigen ligase family protein [Bacteroides fragilis]|nr:O-antigen ligase family protein [Bacteroides fragilis]